MKKFALITLISCLCLGCASTGPAQAASADAQRRVTGSAAIEPIWVTDKAAVYPESEWLCEVASGRDKRSAENAAIADLARIFNVNIQETLYDNQGLARVIESTGRKKREVSSESEKIARELTSSTTVNGLIGVRADSWAAPDGKVHAIARMNKRECSARYAALIRESENLIEYLKAEAEKRPGTPDALELLNAAYDAAQATDNFYRILIVLDPPAAERGPQYGSADMVRALAQDAGRSAAKEAAIKTEPATLDGAIDKAVNGLFIRLYQLEEVQKGANKVGVYDFDIQTEIQEKEKSKGALSRYITGKVNRLFTDARPRFITVERGKMESAAVRAELDLHLSGAISDDTAKSITGATGADIIVTGQATAEPGGYRLSIFATHLEKNERLADITVIIPAGDPQINSYFVQFFRVTAGARAGLSPHFWTLSNDVNGAAESPAFGFEPAVQGAFYITNWFALQTELALSMDKVSYSGDEADGAAYTASFESLSLRVPLLARFTFRPGVFLLSPFAGVSFNIPLGGMKLRSNVYDDSSYRFSIPPGYAAGLNTGIRLGRGSPNILFLDARFSGDLFNTVIHDDSGTLALYKRNTFSFSLGYEREVVLMRN